MAAPQPIKGKNFVSVGYTTTLKESVTGGVWSSSDDAIATVDNNGVVTGIKLGSCTISYTNNDGEETIDFTVNPVRLSNGFNLDRIFPNYLGRIGWHQPKNSKITLSQENLKALSGRYYDRSGHKACTVENLYYAQEDESITSDEFNDFLQEQDEACLMRCITAIFNRPALIEHRINYTRTGNVRNIPIPNTDLFCGYRINIANGDYAVMLNSVSLAFDKSISFNLYLYNDLLEPPIYTAEVSTIANTQTRHQLEWVLNYVVSSDIGTPSGNMGGVVYIGYFQRDIEAQGAKALDEQLNLWSDTKIFGAYPFQAPRIGELDFQRRYPSVNFRNYGLNIEVSSYRDYTQLLIQNAHLFDEARILTMSINALEMIKYSNRTNNPQRLNDENVRDLSLDMNLARPSKDLPFVAGLKEQLTRELIRVSDNFSKIKEAMAVPIGGMQWWNELYYEGMDIRQLPARSSTFLIQK